MDVPSTGTRNNVMGQLRSQVEKHGRKKLSGYKKRFWVVNFHTKRLEVYKNDQSHEPANHWRAEDIRGVIYAGDKQNKFYAMIVQTRLRQTIKFRMSSLEERERWSRAVTQLIDAFSMSHRRNNIFEFLQRRTRAIGRSLNVNISVDWPRLLTAPQEMLEYTVEALDSALANVSALVRDYGADFPVPRNYTLNVQTHEMIWNAREAFPGPQYDPVKKSAVLNVVLYKDALDHVKFFVTAPEEVINIMQSNVFRNPLIEGWIAASPGCAETCDEIRALLGKRTSDFNITFQWGQHLSDSGSVETYLQEFVNEGFFRGVLATVKETLRDVERILEDILITPISTGSTPTPTPRNTTANATSAVSSPLGDKGFASQAPHRTSSGLAAGGVHSRCFSATLFLPSLDASGGGGGGGGGHSSQPTTARGQPRDRGDVGSNAPYQTSAGGMHPLSTAAMNDVRESAVKLLGENITGLAIKLDKQLVDEGRRPPAVVVEHSLDYESHSRPAFLLVAKYSQIYEQQPPTRNSTELHDQLFEVAFHALLSKQISSLRNRLNGVFNGKITVAIMWDRLLQVFRKLNATLFLRDLPKLVNALADVYLPRMLHTVQLMASLRANPQMSSPDTSRRQSGAAPYAQAMGSGAEVGSPTLSHGGALHPAAVADGSGRGEIGLAAMNNAVSGGPLVEDSELTVLDLFTQCVGGVVIDFFSFPELIEEKGGKPHKPTMAIASAALPEPTLVDGNLTDAFLCADESTMSAMVSTVNQLREASSRRAPMLVRNVFAYAATPRLGNWCEKFFSSVDRVAACSLAARKVIEDEFASDSDAGTAEPAIDLGDGEAVANERRAEISVLNTKRVVNTVYDSQGDSIDLKISAQEIRTALRSLQTAFKGKRVTKHDTMRVLTLNLRRLRSMYSLAADGEPNSFLTEATATRLLRHFCEFEETERYIPDALRQYARESYRAHAASLSYLHRPTDNKDSGHQISQAAVAPGDGNRRRGSGSTTTAAPLEGSGRGPLGSDSLGDAGDSSANLSTSSPLSRRGVSAGAPTSAELLERRATLPPTHMEPPSSSTASASGGKGTLHPTTVGLYPVVSIDTPLRLDKTDRYAPSGSRTESPSQPAGGTCSLSSGADNPVLKDQSPSVEVSNHSSSSIDVSASSATPVSTSNVNVPALVLPIQTTDFSDGREPFVAMNGATATSANPNNGNPDSFSHRSDHRDGEAGPLFDFQALCGVALNTLLPREAVTARRAWRTGFVFGLEDAGKSHLVNCIRGFPRQTVATVGLSRQVVAFDEWVFSFDELGGRDSFRKNWQFYVRRIEKVHFLLHVVDCSSTTLYNESLKYLREVLHHFKSEPMVIVFNNYQTTPLPKEMATLEWEYEVDKLRKANPKRDIFVCTHELALVHALPKPTPMPPPLRATLRRLADVLYSTTPESERPVHPKDMAAAGRAARGNPSATAHAHDGGATLSQMGGTEMESSSRVPFGYYRTESFRDASSFFYDYEQTGRGDSVNFGRRGEPVEGHSPF